ncbi:MAG: hypothetical protein ACH34U_13205 [Cyanobium sp.]
MPHPCARVNGFALPPPGWLGEVTAGRAALPRLRWQGALGPAALEPLAPGAHGAALGPLWLMT